MDETIFGGKYASKNVNVNRFFSRSFEKRYNKVNELLKTHEYSIFNVDNVSSGKFNNFRNAKLDYNMNMYRQSICNLGKNENNENNENIVESKRGEDKNNASSLEKIKRSLNRLKMSYLNIFKWATVSKKKLPEVLSEEKLNYYLEILVKFKNNQMSQAGKFDYPLKEQISLKDICTLLHTTWLNDQVVNNYMELIVKAVKGEMNVYSFNTFFYEKLSNSSDGHSAVARWTRRVNIFEKDVVLIPINLPAHWCMLIVDIRNKSAFYLDSLYGSNLNCLETIREYLMKEYAVKANSNSASEYFENFKFVTPESIPKQNNSYDCGVFACLYAQQYVCLDKLNFQFSQKDIPYYRKKMIYELFTASLVL